MVMVGINLRRGLGMRAAIPRQGRGDLVWHRKEVVAS